MSLFETALRKPTKDEVINLTLKYQAKFNNTLSCINKELVNFLATSKKLNPSFLFQKM